MKEKSESAVLKQVGSFFGKVERTLFEIITWLVFVPRTMYWVLSSPREVPDYVRAELTDDQPDTFQDSISPVFLYLLAALGPFLLIQVVDPKLAIAPGEGGFVVDGTSTFTVTKTGGPYGEDVLIRWELVHDSDTILVHQCGPAAQSDCSDEARASFEELVDSVYAEAPAELAAREAVAREVRDMIADRFGGQTANQLFDFWCSSPPWKGCPGYTPELDQYDSAMAFFERAVQDEEATVDAAAAATAEEFGADVSSRVAAFWCSPPAYEGCEGSGPGDVWQRLMSALDEGPPPDSAAWVGGEEDGPLAGAIFGYWSSNIRTEVDPAVSLFARLTQEGTYLSADEARDSVRVQFGEDAATSAAAYWCERPPGPGCDGSTVAYAWGLFLADVEAGVSPEEARVALTEHVAAFRPDPGLVAEIYERWCASAGCGEGARATLSELTEAGESVDDARSAVAARYGVEAGAAEAAYWCAPPAYSGCDGSAVEAAWATFRSSIDAGEPLTSARNLVAEDDAILAEALYDWCYPDGQGCRTPLSADCVNSGTEIRADSVFPSITCAWRTVGSFSVSAYVRRLADDELLDSSEDLGGVVALPADTDDSGAKSQASGGDVGRRAGPPQSLPPEEKKVRQLASTGASQRPDLTQLLGETQTMLIALAMLVLPLGMALVVIPFGDGVTPGSIKPRFYIQCLYLTPVVLAIWIPVVLVNYAPEFEQVWLSVLLAGVLIVMLLGWLLLTEVDFLTSERGVSKRAAVAIWLGALVVSLLAAIVVLFHEAVGASLSVTKFEIVAYIGFGVVVLLLIPGLVGITRLLWGRRKAEP